jgi:hypothetical protein
MNTQESGEQGNEESKEEVRNSTKAVVLNYELRNEDVWGSRCIDPRFLCVGISWK